MVGTAWTKFFWSDWLSDVGLRRCSLAARGLWMDMLCISVDCDPTGNLVLAGRPFDSADIARMTGASVQEVDSLLEELDRNGVFSRDRNGIIYSRRIVRDAKRHRDNVKNGRKGGAENQRKNKENKNSLGQFTKPQPKPPPKPSPSPISQKPESRYHKNDDVLSSDSSAPRARPATPMDEKLNQLVEAAGGNVVNGATGIEIIQPILDLEAMGCDIEADIVPVLSERVRPLAEPLRTWGARWLRDAILARRQARLDGRGLHDGKKPNGTPITDPEKLRRSQETAWRRTLDEYAPSGPAVLEIQVRQHRIPPDFVAKWQAEREERRNGANHQGQANV